MVRNRIIALALALLMCVAACPAVQAEANPSAWISDELVEIRIMRDDSATQPLNPGAIKYQVIEELLNVRLIVESSPAANYSDKKQVLIATDDMPDIMFVSRDDVKKWAREGMFVNLSERRDDMPNLFKLLDANPGYSMLTVDGDFYHAPTLQRSNVNHRPSGQLVNVRVDLFEKYNIAIPATYDELFDAIVEIQANEPDLVGITNRKGGSTTGTRKLLDCMAYPLGSSSGMYFDHDLGGVWIYGPAHENFKEVLEYLNKCYEAGVLDPDYATMTRDQWAEKLSSGRAICTVDNDGVVRNFNSALVTVDPGYTIEVIPSLTNSLGQTRNFTFDFDWLSQAWVISAKSDKIDACVKFLDWCYSDQGADVNGYGKEGVTFDYVDGVQIIKPELLKQFESGANASYDIQSYMGVGLLDITPYVDTGCQMQMEIHQLGSEEAVSAYKALIASISSDTNLRAPVTTPPLSEEQTERYNELNVKVENIVYQEIDKYITGQEPIANYDKVIEMAREAGAEEMEQIYNDAWNDALGK